MAFQGWDNPVGTDGFEFIEYTAPDPVALGKLFEQMGFTAIARHRHKSVTLYRQGEINFIINAEPDSFAQRFARQHGPSICAIAFRVADAGHAYKRALELGAWGFDNKTGPMELNIPAIKGVGDSLIYFVDRWRGKNGAQPGSIGDISIYDVDFEPIPGADPNPVGHGLTYIDHLTHNVHRGRMIEWAEFYERLFNFREARYFDIEGKVTAVKSKAMTFALRQDPHSDQRRRFGDGGPDPGISRRLSRRRHPAHRAGQRATSIARSTACATRKSPCSTPSTPTTNSSTGACRTMANRWRT